MPPFLMFNVQHSKARKGRRAATQRQMDEETKEREGFGGERRRKDIKKTFFLFSALVCSLLICSYD